MSINSIRCDLFLKIGGEYFLSGKSLFISVQMGFLISRYLIGTSENKRSEITEEYLLHPMTGSIHSK